MKVAEIKDVVERQPFRPFKIRLTNGAQYAFTSPRDLGAPRDCHLIFYFGKSESVRIDSDCIAEIIES